MELIQNNLITIVIGFLGSSFIIWAFYKTALNIILNDKNIDMIGNKVRTYLFKMKDSSARLLTRKKIAYIMVDILVDIGFKGILKNNWKEQIINADYIEIDKAD